MTKQLSDHAAAAKAIRTGLKDNGIKASVKAETGSMTSSVRVTILEDIHPKTLKAVKTYCDQFEMGHFNGMEDIYEYSNTQDFPQVKFVFISVEYSDEIKAEVAAYIANISGLESNKLDQYRHMAINGSWGDFWTERAA